MITTASQPAYELSVVIPAFNEATRIGATLESVLDYRDRHGLNWEIVVVDDGSRDATTEIVEGVSGVGVRLIRLPRNQGKGAALRAGVLASQGRWVLLTDADLSTPIDEVERLQSLAVEADLVFGSRAVDGARIELRQPLYREWMGRTFNLVLRMLGLTTLHDTQCGFKLIRGDVARDLFRRMTIARFAYDVELAWLARRHGYRVLEVGVVWRNSPVSRVRAVRDAARMFWDILRIRMRGR